MNHQSTISNTFSSLALLAIILTLSATTNPTLAQTQIGTDVEGQDIFHNFGRSVAMSADGSRMVVGAYLSNDNGSAAGQVQIFQLIGNDWTQIGSNLYGFAGDFFGISVSMSDDGNRIAVGAINADIGGRQNCGSVSIYTLTNGNWNRTHRLIGRVDEAQAGDPVVLSGDGNFIAFGNGGYRTVPNENRRGQVQVWELMVGQASSVGSFLEGDPGDNFGSSIAITEDGSRMAIGASGVDSQSGLVRVYDYTNNWVQAGTDIDGGAIGDQMGIAVAISDAGDRLAVGAARTDGAGEVKSYDYSGGDWMQVANTITGFASDDYFGWHIAMSSTGHRLTISAPFNDDGGADSGQVRAFQFRSGLAADSWLRRGGDIQGDAAGDHFGRGLGMSADGNTIAIGGPSNSGGGVEAGHVRVYSLIDALPIELSNFRGTILDNTALLSWETLSESEFHGFYLEHLAHDRSTNWEQLDFIAGAGTSSVERSYQYQTKDLSSGRHAFRLKQVDLDGTTAYSAAIELVIDLADTHVLGAAYPNPFNPESTFNLVVATDQEVNITLFDQTGRMVQTIHRGILTADTSHNFKIDGNGLSGGVYIYHISGDTFSESRRVVLLK